MRRTGLPVKTNPECLKLFVCIENKSDQDDQMLLYNMHEIQNLPTTFADKQHNELNEMMFDGLKTQTEIAFSAIVQNLHKDNRFETALLSKMQQLLQQKNSFGSSFSYNQVNNTKKIYFDMRHCFDKTLDEPTNIFKICSQSNEQIFHNTFSMQVGNASLQLLPHTLHTQFPVLLAEACTGTQRMKLLAIAKNDAYKKEVAHFVLKNNSLVALHYPQTAKKCFVPLKYNSCYWQNREQMKIIHKLMCKDILLQNADDITVSYTPIFSIVSNTGLQNHLLQKCYSVFS